MSDNQDKPTCEGDACQLPGKDVKQTDTTSNGSLDLGELLNKIEHLVDGDLEAVSPQVLEGKIVGIYFSASWCPPCKAFSPVLTQFAKENKDEFVVVHVNLDKTKEDMDDFIKGKNWLCVPYEDEQVKKALGSQLQVYSIPSLAIVDTNTKQLVTTWGRLALNKNRNNCLKEWKEGNHGCSWYHMFKFW